MDKIELLGVSDVGRILGISASYVRRLERMGKLRAFRVGTSQMRVFSRASVERLAAARQARRKGDEE